VARKVIGLVAALLVLNALLRVTPPFLRYQRFKDALQSLTEEAKGKTDAILVEEVMALAGELEVPLEREWITVRRSRDLMHTYIDATWAEELAVVPGWKYLWIVEVTADGWHLKRRVAQDVR
jgi:hypothetical protein